MALGPLDLAGGPFLALYVALLAAAWAAGLIVPDMVRPAGEKRPVANADQLAFLAGGATRFIETILSQLLAAKAVAMAGRNKLVVIANGYAASPAEKAVLALPSPFRWRDARLALEPHLELLERRMIASGLLMSVKERVKLRLLGTLPYFLLLAFGGAKLAIGIHRDRPVSYLVVLLGLTAVVALIRWMRADPRTRGGRDAIATARERASRLRRAPTTPEVGVAVALFGTLVLAGSGWPDFHRMRQAGDGVGTCGDGGGGSCGGGSGCGGGGGGCGGCSGG